MQRNDRNGPRAGFSLIEVAVSLMVAASALLSAFALFPSALRQSAESRTELVETDFAVSLLEAIAGNVRQIDDVADWNDPDKWWSIARKNLFAGEIGKTATDPKKFRDGLNAGTQKVDGFSMATFQVAVSYKDNGRTGRVRYYGNEMTAAELSARGERPANRFEEPPQWLVRVNAIRRHARSGGRELSGTWLPTRYVVSVVSSPVPSPESFIFNPVYSREYAFIRRP